MSGLPAGPFGVILADPPWRYGFSRSKSRKVENQYPTMDLDAIRALPVASIAAPDAVLFLWATAPKLPEALRVMASWDFEYKTGAVWDKQAMGMGYYFRVQHEHLLVGTRGKPGVPAPHNRHRSIVSAPRTRHSAKPGLVYVRIEHAYPAARRVELFARVPREGWTAWGNEIAKAVEGAA